jgi:hypothetical protein
MLLLCVGVSIFEEDIFWLITMIQPKTEEDHQQTKELFLNVPHAEFNLNFRA